MEPIILLVWFFLAVGVGVLAGNRGRNGVGYFLLALLLSPLLGLIAVLVSRDLEAEARADQQRTWDHQRELAALQALTGAPKTVTTPVRDLNSWVLKPPPAEAPQLVADELQKLLTLKQAGALTEDEFAQQKRRLLDGGAG